MFYDKNKQPVLSKKLFKNPTSEYRGTPFWSWNNKLDVDELLWQIEILKEMGMGGFHIHSRTGMATEYLSDSFMSLVKACQKKAVEEDMLCYLYDEDRWPSGFAGGYVTKFIKNRARFALFTPFRSNKHLKNEEEFCCAVDAFQNGNGELPTGYFLACYAIKLENGYLSSYNQINIDDECEDGFEKWYLYIELQGESPWHNNQTYVDTLNKNAIDEFIKITYDRYYEVVGDEFGKSIPSIFTDEPQFVHKTSLNLADEKKEIILPFTNDFPTTFMNRYKEDILQFFPELIWELSNNRVSVARYRYHDHICERFAQAFADNVGKWCNEHNIMLTGHMMEEPTLRSQTAALGETMRSYRSFGLPGIDMLMDSREFTTAKQAQSAARQYNSPGVLSELYGVTNWDFDFSGHKLQGDWQAALGITVRVHHLSWVSMEGESKRDYPASIHYQSPWYKKYPLIEDHFARVNTAMTRGRAKTTVGVIHPVESYWLLWGPTEHTFQRRNELEQQFDNFIKWMLFGLIDFDYISESLLPEQCQNEGSPLKVGDCEYSTIIVPGCLTLRETTVKILDEFCKGGGHVIFMGDYAKYVDAEETKVPQLRKLIEKSEKIAFSNYELMNSLRYERVIDICRTDGVRTDNLIHQMRKDGDVEWLFICHVYQKHGGMDEVERLSISVKGTWSAEIWDTISGEVSRADFSVTNGNTKIYAEMFAHDSLLIKLVPINESDNESEINKSENNEQCPENCSKGIMSQRKINWIGEIISPESVTFSEPNVFLLDMADYSIDNGEWYGEEEILRIGSAVRKKAGWISQVGENVVQKWVSSSENLDDDTRLLTVKYTIISDIDVDFVKLALEQPDCFTIELNGEQVTPTIDGYYIDKSIKTFELPANSIKKGENTLILKRNVNKLTDMESCYLLGDFGVEVNGRFKKIIAKNESVQFGSLVGQGYPFYGGNVQYKCNFDVTPDYAGKEIILELPHFKAPLVSVSLDGKEVGDIAFAPYRINLGVIEVGKHNIELCVYGNRFNTLGQLHFPSTDNMWSGPSSWRTGGVNWTYEYNLRPFGTLSSPIIKFI